VACEIFTNFKRGWVFLVTGLLEPERFGLWHSPKETAVQHNQRVFAPPSRWGGNLKVRKLFGLTLQMGEENLSLTAFRTPERSSRSGCSYENYVCSSVGIMGFQLPASVFT
jgi:hypothetical protein